MKGSTLIPAVAVLTIFAVSAILITQSGLISAVLLKLAAIQ